MLDLNGIFEDETVIFLDNINFDLLDTPEIYEESDIVFTDSVNAEIIDDETVRVIFTRDMNFMPTGLYTLSVSFGQLMHIKREHVGKIDWEHINLAEEFHTTPDYLSDIVSRTALLIAQITSSFGQPPIISPPVVFGDDNNTGDFSLLN